MQRLVEHQSGVPPRKGRDHAASGRERHIRLHVAGREHGLAQSSSSSSTTLGWRRPSKWRRRALVSRDRLRRAEQRGRAVRHLAAGRSHTQRQQALARGALARGRASNHQGRRRHSQLGDRVRRRWFVPVTTLFYIPPTHL